MESLRIIVLSVLILFSQAYLTFAQYCGDGVCQTDRENCETCPEDCSCPAGYKCDPDNPNATARGCVEIESVTERIIDLIEKIVYKIYWYAKTNPLTFIVILFIFALIIVAKARKKKKQHEEVF